MGEIFLFLLFFFLPFLTNYQSLETTLIFRILSVPCDPSLVPFHFSFFLLLFFPTFPTFPTFAPLRPCSCHFVLCWLFTLCSLPSALYPLLFTLCFLPSALYPLLFTLCSLPSALYPLLFTLCSFELCWVLSCAGYWAVLGSEMCWVLRCAGFWDVLGTKLCWVLRCAGDWDHVVVQLGCGIQRIGAHQWCRAPFPLPLFPFLFLFFCFINW